MMMTELASRCYRKYQRNVALAEALEANLPSDDGWSVVVRFYAALHLVNAFLMDEGNVNFELASTAHED
jgi:hypothetical protein